jgi:hypothetical protein
MESKVDEIDDQKEKASLLQSIKKLKTALQVLPKLTFEEKTEIEHRMGI